MHSFMGEVTVHTASYSHFPCPGCCFFLSSSFFFIFFYFLSSFIHRGPFAALHAMLKTHYPTNIILDIIEKGIGRVSRFILLLGSD